MENCHLKLCSILVAKSREYADKCVFINPFSLCGN